jgi:predicted TIM-barrel fold metal-dependent hydrolase
MMDAQIPIFDVDTHYTEPPDLWTSRAPSKYKGQVLHVRQNSLGAEAWYIGDHGLGLIGATVIDSEMKKHFGVVTMPKFSDASRAGAYAKERIAHMDDAGVGTQLVYANVIGFGGCAMMEVASDPELRLWHVQAYNDAILDLQKDSGGRILPQAALPLWDLDASITELHRARKMGLTGVAMSDNPGHFGQPPLGHPKWEGFFLTCQDLGLPVNFHVGSGSWLGDIDLWWGEDKTPIRADGALNSPMIIFMSSVIAGRNQTDVANLIMSGVLEKYPKLNFVSVESGCGWAPTLIQALEYNWDELMSADYKRQFKRRPKQMFMEQVYCTYWLENRNAVDSFINEFGPENLMFETDFPHPVCLYPNSSVKAKVAETLGHRPRELQEKVLHRNAERVYGVNVHQPPRAAAAALN